MSGVDKDSSGKKGAKVAPGTDFRFRANTDITNASDLDDASTIAIAPARDAVDHPEAEESAPAIPPSRAVYTPDKTDTRIPEDPAAEIPATEFKMKAEPKKNVKTFSKRSISPDTVSNSQNILTMARGRDMGYRTSPYWWRKVVMNPDHLKSKMTALEHKIKVLKDHKYDSDQLNDLLANVTAAIKQGKVTRSSLLTLLQNNQKSGMLVTTDNSNAGDVLEDLLNPQHGALYKGMQQQFGRGLPSAVDQIPVSLATLHDDVSFKQRVDISNEYEAAEILNTLRQMVMYQNTEIKLLDGGASGCTITIPGTNFGASCILNKGANGNNMLEFSAKDNSEESLLHFADLVSMMRQGETNTIEFTDLGDPVAALSLLNDLLVDKRMHVVLTDEAKSKFLKDIAGLKSLKDDKGVELYQAAEIKKIETLANIYLANLQTFHPQNPRALSTWYSSKSPVVGSYANEVNWKNRNAAKAATWLYDKTTPLLRGLNVVTIAQDIEDAVPAGTASKKGSSATSAPHASDDADDLVVAPSDPSSPSHR